MHLCGPHLNSWQTIGCCDNLHAARLRGPPTYWSYQDDGELNCTSNHFAFNGCGVTRQVIDRLQYEHGVKQCLPWLVPTGAPCFSVMTDQCCLSYMKSVIMTGYIYLPNVPRISERVTEAGLIVCHNTQGRVLPVRKSILHVKKNTGSRQNGTNIASNLCRS